MEENTPEERRGLLWGSLAFVAGVAALVALSWSKTSPLRSPSGELTAFSAPLMQSIVPLIFLLFLLPGLVHGYASGTFKNHRHAIAGMSKTMSTMGYYIVMAFFAALFIYAFNNKQARCLARGQRR